MNLLAMNERVAFYITSCQPPNKQLQRTVIRRRGRGACALFHFAHAPRWTRGRAAAELRRYAAQMWRLEAGTAMVAQRRG
jgi:hypothetical protein